MLYVQESKTPILVDVLLPMADTYLEWIRCILYTSDLKIKFPGLVTRICEEYTTFACLARRRT